MDSKLLCADHWRKMDGSVRFWFWSWVWVWIWIRISEILHVDKFDLLSFLMMKIILFFHPLLLNLSFGLKMFYIQQKILKVVFWLLEIILSITKCPQWLKAKLWTLGKAISMMGTILIEMRIYDGHSYCNCQICDKAMCKCLVKLKNASNGQRSSERFIGVSDVQACWTVMIRKALCPLCRLRGCSLKVKWSDMDVQSCWNQSHLFHTSIDLFQHSRYILSLVMEIATLDFLFANGC